MAYIDQSRKAEIAANLKRVIPAGWKYSLAVRHHSTLVLTISAAPIDLLSIYMERLNERRAQRGVDRLESNGAAQLNVYHLADAFTGPLGAIFSKIHDAMNDGNHDRSDSQTDYFDVGWYVAINIGRWDKPFVCTVLELAAA